LLKLEFQKNIYLKLKIEFIEIYRKYRLERYFGSELAWQHGIAKIKLLRFLSKETLQGAAH
jgi:hypothetical protein